MDTIFALSSGSPPSAIAIVRVSGAQAQNVVCALTQRPLPPARVATLALLTDPSDQFPLDKALVLWFPGPASATGEDVAEFHLHGGRAVVAAVLNVLIEMDGMRPADPGEFTRRAFENGRMDFAEAEGLGDLLSAETEMQRRNAIAQIDGALHRMTHGWSERIVALSALVEAAIDFSDEADVAVVALDDVRQKSADIALDIQQALERPPAERLREGIRVAIIGPPNAGKSTLLNRLAGRDAALVSDIAGTTRDVIEVPLNFRGVPFVFVDTAGIRDTIIDPIERMGVDRALAESRTADIIISLGAGLPLETSEEVIPVKSKCDLFDDRDASELCVSAHTGEGVEQLLAEVSRRAIRLLPAPGTIAFNSRHRAALNKTVVALENVRGQEDELLMAEDLRAARHSLRDVTGGNDTEGVLDVLFGNFCIGK